MQIRENIQAWAKKQPEQLALSFPQVNKSFTYGGLCKEVQELGDSLLAAGVKPGQISAIIFQETDNIIFYLLALLFIGAMPVPLDIGLAESDLVDLLKFLEPSAIIVSKTVTKSVNCVREVSGYEVHTSTNIREGTIFINHNHQKQFDFEPSIFLPTSGTTGNPKIVQILSSSIVSNAKSVTNFLDITNKDIFLSLTPPIYCHGFYNGVLMPLINGASAVVLAKFNVFMAAKFWNIISRHSITVVNAVPSMLKIISGIKYQQLPDVGSLRFFICGTAKLAAEEKKAFEGQYNIPIYTQFGTTESLINTINKSANHDESQGIAVGCSLKIVDEVGVNLLNGDTGEIAVSGDTITPGYFKNEKLSQKVIRQKCFYTGDLGYVDQSGFLYIKGRNKEIINRGGLKIFPEEIDRVLCLNEHIAECYTIGMPDTFYGEEVYTFVVFKKNKETSIQQLYGFLRRKISKNKIPKEIITIPAIPRGATGKPKLQALRELLSNRNTPQGVRVNKERKEQ